jgi:hypothetical protein
MRRNSPCPCGSGKRYKHCCGLEVREAPLATGPLSESDIFTVEGFLDAGACRELRALAGRQPQEPARIYTPDDREGDAGFADTAATTDRYSSQRVTTIIKTAGMAEQVVPLVGRAFLEHVAPRYGVRFEWFEWPDILEYGPGGHFDMHADAEMYDPVHGWRRTDDRDFSLLLYLSDDFTGGELEFPRYGITIRPRAGLLVVFPSDHRYVHTAHPVTSGRRQVLVSWGTILGSPRVHPRPRHKVVLTPRDGLPVEE